MTELKLGNDPVGVASSHEFDFHPDDKTRSGNNPFQPPRTMPTDRRTNSICNDRAEGAGRLARAEASSPVVPGSRGDRPLSLPPMSPATSSLPRATWCCSQRTLAAASSSEVMFTQGELAVADLSLDSAAAIPLTLSLVDPDGQGGPKPSPRRTGTGSLETYFFTQNSQTYFFKYRGFDRARRVRTKSPIFKPKNPLK